MNFFEKLEEIRQRPIESRRRILLVSLALSMTAVIAIWLGTMKLENSGSEKISDSGPSPWEVLKNTFESSKKELKNSLPGEVYIKE